MKESFKKKSVRSMLKCVVNVERCKTGNESRCSANGGERRLEVDTFITICDYAHRD